MQTECSRTNVPAWWRSLPVVLAAAMLMACGAPLSNAGADLGAVAAADGAPDPRGGEAEAILPTPDVWVHPHPPRAVEATDEGTVYVSRVDFTNRGAVPFRIPTTAVETVVRAGDERLGCELRSVATNGVPVLEPGEVRSVEFRSLCPTPEGPHEVVSYVELPELLGEDALYAGRAVVAAAEPEAGDDDES
jgi:hypothetical protein